MNRLSYEPEERVTVQIHVENHSAVDVSGSTLKVITKINCGTYTIVARSFFEASHYGNMYVCLLRVGNKSD